MTALGSLSAHNKVCFAVSAELASIIRKKHIYSTYNRNVDRPVIMAGSSAKTLSYISFLQSWHVLYA